jgi:hypothetical protein
MVLPLHYRPLNREARNVLGRQWGGEQLPFFKILSKSTKQAWRLMKTPFTGYLNSIYGVL